MAWTLVGQESALKVLGAAAASGTPAHAYLFTGPAHTGKTLAALQFAQALNCTGDDPPCGRCRQCEHIASNTHADVEIVTMGGLCDDRDHDHAKDNSRDIRVCQTRRMEQVISRAPFEGKWRVQIIEPADRLNDIAQNALLKTLEEPPANVVLILITDAEDKLIDTIRSRVRRVSFGGLSQSAIESALRTRWDVAPEQAGELSRLAGGRLGWAVIALHDEKMMRDRQAALDAAQELAGAPIAERFAYANTLGSGYTKDRAGTQQTLEMWQEWWRDILLIASGREQQATHRDRLPELHALAARTNVAGAARAVRAITDARAQLDENASPVLVLEVMMLALPELRANAVASRLAR